MLSKYKAKKSVVLACMPTVGPRFMAFNRDLPFNLICRLGYEEALCISLYAHIRARVDGNATLQAVFTARFYCNQQQLQLGETHPVHTETYSFHFNTLPLER